MFVCKDYTCQCTWYTTLAIYNPLINAGINLLLKSLKSGGNGLIDSGWNPCIHGLVNYVFNKESKAINIIQLTVAC